MSRVEKPISHNTDLVMWMDGANVHVTYFTNIKHVGTDKHNLGIFTIFSSGFSNLRSAKTDLRLSEYIKSEKKNLSCTYITILKFLGNQRVLSRTFRYQYIHIHMYTSHLQTKKKGHKKTKRRCVSR